MSRSWPVIKREFTEMVRTKMYIIGTVLGPVLIALLMVAPLLFMRASGGGERQVLLLDATATGIGQEIADALNASGAGAGDFGIFTTFRVESMAVVGDGLAERQAARARIGDQGARSLDGYLFLPEGFLTGELGLYEGRNATSMTQMGQLDAAVAAAVRSRRMTEAGVAPEVMGQIMAPTRIEKRKPGSAEAEGAGAETAMALGYLMVFAVYFAVVLFAAAVMRGVLEEKRDRIVEVLLSSIRARNFITGKVLGIGIASLLQMMVWVGFAALVLTYGPGIAAARGYALPELPGITPTVAIAFLFFFSTGFLLYAAMFGAAGAIATSDQEANQLQFPVTIPLLIGLFMAYTVLVDADSTLAVAGTLIPWTAPMVIPFRSVMTDIPLAQYLAAAVLMIAAVVGTMGVTAKIYRIGVLSTGKKPTLKELARWLRAA
jgi:ABC-2 type transport system permease protein